MTCSFVTELRNNDQNVIHSLKCLQRAGAVVRAPGRQSAATGHTTHGTLVAARAPASDVDSERRQRYCTVDTAPRLTTFVPRSASPSNTSVSSTCSMSCNLAGEDDSR